MISLSFRGRIDSANAHEFGRRLADALNGDPGQPPVIDFDGVEYSPARGCGSC